MNAHDLRDLAIGEFGRRAGLSIKALRLYMPLAVVAEVLSGSDEEAAARLDRWWTGQEQDMQAGRSSMVWFRAHLLAGRRWPGAGITGVDGVPASSTPCCTRCTPTARSVAAGSSATTS